jgi:GT2 family glycosyltransferase/glycosyltransferase involved in cell wall biosynthesis
MEGDAGKSSSIGSMIQFEWTPEPLISIIVVAWREAPFLLSCLASVKETDKEAPFETILVLNEPSPRLTESVAREIAGATVLKFQSNLGFGGGVNVAAESARGRFLLLLNDDSVVERGWLGQLVNTAIRRPHAGMVGSTYLHPDGTLQEAGSILWSDGTTSAFGEDGSGANWDFERKVDYCSGGSLLIRKELWDQLCGFDDCYYPAYFEDIDLALRADDVGWEVWYQPLSVLRHVRSGSSGRLHGFLYERSRGQFLDRWRPKLGEFQHRCNYETAAWWAMGHPIRVLVLDDHLPDPSIGAGYGRMSDTLTALAEDPGVHVAVYPTIAPRMDSALLRSIGVRVIEDLTGHLGAPGVNYDVVVVSRPNNFLDYHDQIRTTLPGARLIYDAEALFYRRLETRLDFVADGSDRTTLRAEASEARDVERWIFSSADAVVCISEEEAALVRSETASPVHVIEAWFATPTPTTAPFEQRSDIGLVAGWAAGPGSPNALGLVWFAREVLPRVRAAIPGCRLLVTGANPPDDVNWLAGRAVEFVGHVQDLGTFYNRIRVAISPTLFGAGVKLKTVEAIQHAVPVVTTREAAAGLDPLLHEAVWAVNDPADFAQAIAAIYRDPDVWNSFRDVQLGAVEQFGLARAGTRGWPDLIRDAVAKPTIVSER